jgi:tripartite-type tricarboxylate transporter receptor subunit TctC
LQKKIYADVKAVLETRVVHDAIYKSGADPVLMSQAEFSAYLKRDLESWGTVVRDRKITLD